MIAFSIFGFDVYRYGIFYIISFLICYGILCFLLPRIKNIVSNRVFEVLNTKKDDFFIFIFLGVILGGRLGHFLIYYPFEFFSNPFVFFSFHQGGMSFIGGIIGVIISLFIFFKINKLTINDILQILDITSILAPIGSMIGRWGNFLNQELYGIPVSSSVLSKLSSQTQNFLQKIHIIHNYNQVDNILRINTNMLASLGEGLFVFIVIQICFWKFYKNKNNIKPGLVSFLWLFFYSFVRFLLECRRQDSQSEFVGLFTKSQRFFLIFGVVCIIMIIIFSKKTSNPVFFCSILRPSDTSFQKEANKEENKN